MKIPTAKLVRRVRGLSQVELAVKAGVSPSTVYRLEAGRDVSEAKARAIAEALTYRPEAS